MQSCNSRHLSTRLSTMVRSSRWKVNKETPDLNYILDQMKLTDIYGTFHSTAAKYILFSSTHRTLTCGQIHMLSHKTYFNKFKRTETMSSTFLDDNGMKVEINNRKKMLELHKYVKIKHVAKQPMGHRRNQKGNQKLP